MKFDNVKCLMNLDSKQSCRHMAAPNLRIASLNVHYLRHSDCLVKILRPHQIDVLSLNEAPSSLLPFAEELGMTVLSQRIADHGLFNALLVRKGLQCTSDFSIDLPDSSKNTRENRSAVSVFLPDWNLTVCSLHLDAFNEDSRLAQFDCFHESLQAHLAEPMGGSAVFVAGDFNALRRADYGDGEWRNLKQKRADARILSLTDLTDRIASLGYSDCRSASLSSATGPTKTSVFGARVDYVFSNRCASEKFDVLKYHHDDSTLGAAIADDEKTSQPFLSAIRNRLGKGGGEVGEKVEARITCSITDHCLVICDLRGKRDK
jgi:endonuclease/exonuclease/phosphatase family metal-dependent hydrolase